MKSSLTFAGFVQITSKRKHCLFGLAIATVCSSHIVASLCELSAGKVSLEIHDHGLLTILTFAISLNARGLLRDIHSGSKGYASGSELAGRVQPQSLTAASVVSSVHSSSSFPSADPRSVKQPRHIEIYRDTSKFVSGESDLGGAGDAFDSRKLDTGDTETTMNSVGSYA